MSSPIPTILVVDDNAPALKAAVRLLRQAGYEVVEASSVLMYTPKSTPC